MPKNNKAFGPEEIPYELYKNAPDNILKAILKIFNLHWSRGEYPESLKNVWINPIIKPGKNSTYTKSYRFICRISCIGKIYKNIKTKINLVSRTL